MVARFATFPLLDIPVATMLLNLSSHYLAPPTPARTIILGSLAWMLVTYRHTVKMLVQASDF